MSTYSCNPLILVAHEPCLMQILTTPWPQQDAWRNWKLRPLRGALLPCCLHVASLPCCLHEAPPSLLVRLPTSTAGESPLHFPLLTLSEAAAGQWHRTSSPSKGNAKGRFLGSLPSGDSRPQLQVSRSCICLRKAAVGYRIQRTSALILILWVTKTRRATKGL